MTIIAIGNAAASEFVTREELISRGIEMLESRK